LPFVFVFVLILSLFPLVWTPQAEACNARKADSIHAHSHLVPTKRAFTVGKAEFGLTPCNGGQAGAYPCKDVDLLSFVPLGELGATGGTTANDVWGWTDPQTGKEYAVVGLSDGVSFVDISNPENPRFLGRLPTATIASGWRDIKVYRNHAYVVADNAQGHGVQIFDLTRLRGLTAPQAWSADRRYTQFGSAHNIAINEETGFAYAVGSNTCAGGLHMMNLSNPKNPTFAGCFDADGYTHDVQCVVYKGADATYRNREICFASNEDTLTIVDVNNKTAPSMIARIGYNGSGYTHQAWLTENHRYLLMDDEGDERNNGHNTRTYIWDVRDLDNPQLIGRYNAATGSIDHNLYIRGGFAFQANYLAGLRILELDRVQQGQLREVAFFDVAPGRDNTNFSGSWSVYPFFESGAVLLTDIGQGLFIVRPQVGNFGAPIAPSGLDAALDAEGVRLTWQDNAGNETGYRLLRGESGAALTALAELPEDAVEYLDTAIEPGATYNYQLVAFNDAGETIGGQVTVSIPAPVSVGIAARPAAGSAGDPLVAGVPVLFEGAFTGPGVEARWTFGADGLALPAAPCGEGVFCATHIFPEPGSYNVSITAEGNVGQTAAATAIVQVVDGGVALAEEDSLLQSVILGPRGDTGTFRSNVWVHNAGAEPASVDFTYLPRALGQDGSERRRLTILPGSTLFVEDVLGTLFGISTGQGSLRLTYRARQDGGGPQLSAISRSFVELADAAAGSFGQLVAEDRLDAFNAAPKAAAGVLEGDGFITTLLVANLDDEPGRVTIELFDADGEAVGDPLAAPVSLGLGSRVTRTQRIVQLFPDVVNHEGPFTVRFLSSGIPFAASATLLEAESEDQIFVPAQEEATAPVYYLPRVVRGTGQFDVQLTSWLVVANESAGATELTVELWLRGQSNSEPQTTTRTLAAGETLVLRDVIRDLFALDTATGALRISWQNGDGKAPRLLSYGFASTSSGAPGGTEGGRFGMRIGTLTDAAAIADVGVQFGAEQSDLFRSSYGVVNLNESATVLRLELRDGDGAVLHEAELVLRPFQHLERNLAGIFDGLGEGSNWTIRTRVVAGGPVLTYLANINASGDVFFVPGAP
jgi:choice-of-anchor B domain-containing protein